MSNTKRFEYKYPMSTSQYLRVRAALLAWMRHDQFSRSSPQHRYFVRSLYYDTDSYTAYEEKVTGATSRIKLRVRSYWPTRSQAQFLKVELKTKVANLTDKYSLVISLQEYDHFMNLGVWSRLSDPISDEFLRAVLLKAMRPRVLVDYHREGLEPSDASGLRVTFDHNTQSAAADEVFPSTAYFRAVDPHQVIMEIKTHDDPPLWLQRLVKRFGLHASPHSKYALAVEQTQHAMYQ